MHLEVRGIWLRRSEPHRHRIRRPGLLTICALPCCPLPPSDPRRTKPDRVERTGPGRAGSGRVGSGRRGATVGSGAADETVCHLHHQPVHPGHRVGYQEAALVEAQVAAVLRLHQKSTLLTLCRDTRGCTRLFSKQRVTHRGPKHTHGYTRGHTPRLDTRTYTQFDTRTYTTVRYEDIHHG